MAFVYTGISLSGWVDFHFGFEPSLALIPFTYMKVVVIVELAAILEPDDFGPWLPGGHTNEDDFVAQYVFVVEMRGLGNAGTLRVPVILLGILCVELICGWNSYLTVGRISSNSLVAHP